MLAGNRQQGVLTAAPGMALKDNEGSCISQGSLKSQNIWVVYIVREFVDDLQSVVQLPITGQQQLWMEAQGSSSYSVPQGKQVKRE